MIPNIKEFDKYNKENLYSESGQDNPIRWMCLKHVEGNDFIPVTYTFRCKDYFNDIVGAYQLNKSVTMYKFTCDPEIFFNKEWAGVPVLLMNLKPDWLYNLDTVLNPYLETQKMPSLSPIMIGNNKAFLNIPQEYLQNTLFISELTLLIRVINNLNKKGTKIEDFGVSTVCGYMDCILMSKLLQKPMGKLHQSFKNHIYSWQYKAEAKSDFIKNETTWTPEHSHFLHSCGVQNWAWK